MSAQQVSTDQIGIIITLAEALFSAVSVGNPAPVVRSMMDWMRAEPQPGDLVVEMSTGFRGPSPERVGTFERRESKLVCCHEQLDVALDRCSTCTDEERFNETFTWIRCLEPDGAAHHRRWYNCDFRRVPMTKAQRRESEAAAAMVDRDAAPRVDPALTAQQQVGEEK